MNRENLKKLADGLRGPLVAEFDMGAFVYSRSDQLQHEDDVESVADFCSTNPGCGTAACAAGHATYLVTPKRPDETFHNYCKRVFDVDPLECGGPWDWCFSAGWSYVDNTPAGAADRIDWMLINGVPSDCEEQLRDGAPLCYRTAL